MQEDAPETLRVVQAASEGAFAPAPSHKDARSEFNCLAQDFTDSFGTYQACSSGLGRNGLLTVDSKVRCELYCFALQSVGGVVRQDGYSPLVLETALHFLASHRSFHATLSRSRSKRATVGKMEDALRKTRKGPGKPCMAGPLVLLCCRASNLQGPQTTALPEA